MKINYKDISLNIKCKQADLKSKHPVLFLHGFTGSANDWDFVTENLEEKFTPIFVDLVGHGQSDSPDNPEYYGINFQIELLKNMCDYLDLDKINLVGYSMGGRLALAFATNFRENVESLVLESTSFGIVDKNDRLERIHSDEKLAKQIENSSIGDFIKYWINTPLFDSLNKVEPARLEKLLENKIKRNNQKGLKNSLLGCSTGKMKNYFLELGNLSTDIMLIVGALDQKFVGINTKANSLFTNSELRVIKESGHNVHFEKPKEFLKLLNRFLLNVEGNK